MLRSLTPLRRLSCPPLALTHVRTRAFFILLPLFQFRMEHSVAMQNRGLLRHPFAVLPSSSPPPSPPRGASPIEEGDNNTEPPAPTNASRIKTPGAALSTEEHVDPGNDGHYSGNHMPVAAQSGEDSGLYERDEPPVGNPPNRGENTVPSESTAAAARLGAAGMVAAMRKPASPTAPRLEEWPGFPSPSTAFARAAPMENPKGVLPPSPHVLRFIHQVGASGECERCKEMCTHKDLEIIVDT